MARIQKAIRVSSHDESLSDLNALLADKWVVAHVTPCTTRHANSTPVETTSIVYILEKEEEQNEAVVVNNNEPYEHP